MKAFLLSLVVLVAVALGAGYLMDSIFERDADAVFTSENVRL